MSLGRKTSLAQKKLEQVIDKLVSFVLHAHLLLMKHPYDVAYIKAMDESLVWADMVSETTVDDTGKKNYDCKNN